MEDKKRSKSTFMDIVTLTCLAVDIYPDAILECVGGNALNVATQCRRSGVEHVAVLGAVGMDGYADALVHHLAGAGIDILLGSLLVNLEVRYTLGFMPPTGADFKNGAFSFSGGVGFQL